MEKIFLSLGSNIAPREEYMKQMLLRLADILHPPRHAGQLMETEPLEVAAAQPWYLNCIVSGTYAGSAPELLKECERIEKECGRRTKGGHAPRTADIDILLFGDYRIATRDLTIPHPACQTRRFCLEGLRTIASRQKLPCVGHLFPDNEKAMPSRIRAQKISFQQPATHLCEQVACMYQEGGS